MKKKFVYIVILLFVLIQLRSYSKELEFVRGLPLTALDSICVSPSGKYCAGILSQYGLDSHNSLAVFDIGTSTIVQNVRINDIAEDVIPTTIKFLNDSILMVHYNMGVINSYIFKYNVIEGKFTDTIKIDGSHVAVGNNNVFCFMNDVVYIVPNKTYIFKYDLETGKFLGEIPNPTAWDDILAFAASADGNVFALSYQDTIIIRDKNGNDISKITEYNKKVGLYLKYSGDTLVIYKDNVVTLWDTKTGTKIWTTSSVITGGFHINFIIRDIAYDTWGGTRLKRLNLNTLEYDASKYNCIFYPSSYIKDGQEYFIIMVDEGVVALYNLTTEKYIRYINHSMEFIGMTTNDSLLGFGSKYITDAYTYSFPGLKYIRSTDLVNDCYTSTLKGFIPGTNKYVYTRTDSSETIFTVTTYDFLNNVIKEERTYPEIIESIYFTKNMKYCSIFSYSSRIFNWETDTTYDFLNNVIKEERTYPEIIESIYFTKNMKYCSIFSYSSRIFNWETDTTYDFLNNVIKEERMYPEIIESIYFTKNMKYGSIDGYSSRIFNWETDETIPKCSESTIWNLSYTGNYYINKMTKDNLVYNIIVTTTNCNNVLINKGSENFEMLYRVKWALDDTYFLFAPDTTGTNKDLEYIIYNTKTGDSLWSATTDATHGKIVMKNCQILRDRYFLIAYEDSQYALYDLTNFTKIADLSYGNTLIEKIFDITADLQYIICVCDNMFSVLRTGLDVSRVDDTQNRSVQSVIKLSPNPTEESATLEFTSELLGDVHLKIMNESGYIIEEINVDKDNNEFKFFLDFSNYPSGAYIITAFVDDKLIGSEKLILNK